MSRPVNIVLATLAARRAGNVEAMNTLSSDAITFTFNVDPDAIGSGRTVIGWDAVQQHLQRVDRHWERIASEVVASGEAHGNPERVILQIRFKLRHRASGEILEGIKRQEWTVRGGVVTRADEIFDAAAVHAFQRLAHARSTPSDERTN